MSTLAEVVIGVLSLVVVAMVLYIRSLVIMHQKHVQALQEQHHADYENWTRERQMLLDRIQAPSFAEYTAKVVREKKAEQPEEKQEPVEFVS